MKSDRLPARLLFAFVVLGIWVSMDPLGFAAEWFVSPDGNDSATGMRPDATAGGGHGPFATLERAREAVRQRIQAGDPGLQTVSVRAGAYPLREPLRLDARDSGSQTQPVIWRAYRGEKPRITGTMRLPEWTVWKGGIYRAPLEKKAVPPGGIRQLILAGERQVMARYPNAEPSRGAAGGWAFADGKGWPMYADIPGEDKRTLEVLPGDWRAWARPAEAELVVFARYNWWNDRVRIHSLDAASRKITLAKDCSYAIRKGDRYFFQNALEELDSPGEWYADAAGGMVYFWPPEGARAADAELVVAQLLLVFEKGAHDIVWQGFTLEGCNGTAVTLEGASRCRVEENWIRNAGDWSGGGVTISGGDSNRVAYNTIEKVGRTGVSVSGGSVATLTPGNHVAEHNHIRQFGVYFKQGVGVDLGGVGNKALHNEIHEGPRFGIGHKGNCNQIGWNHIYNVCLETEDTGAIYSGGRDWITPRGTSIFYNYIHDIPGFGIHEGRIMTPHFAWGIYLDDNSGGVDVYGNVVTRCGRAAMHGHGARDCVVSNNIFVGNRDWQFDFHGWSTQQSFWERHLPAMVRGYESVADKTAWKGMRGMELHPTKAPLPDGLTMRGNVFVQNVVVSEQAEVPVMSILRVPFTHNQFDYNVYWSPQGRVRTGFVSAGPDQGADLIAPFSGEPGTTPPTGWRWSAKPAGNPGMVLQKSGDDTTLVLTSEPGADVKGQVAVSGPECELEPGATYRLRVRLRAGAPTKVSVSVQSSVSKVYFWSSPGGAWEAGPEWTERELVFEVPGPGTKGWHEQMKRFSPRVGMNAGSGVLEIAWVHLHRAEPRSQWDAWRAQGIDAHSVVADPRWAQPRTFSFAPDSPVWATGFQRIPLEQIGPQSKPH